MDENQNVVPIQTNTLSPSPTSTSTRTSISTSISGPTDPVESPAATSAPPVQASEPNDGPSAAAIAGGVVAGVIVLLGIIVLAIIVKKKRRASESGSPPKMSRSSSSFGNISGPMLPANWDGRVDFSSISPGSARTRGMPESKDDPSSVTGAIIASSATTPNTAAMFAPGPYGQQQRFSPKQSQQHQKVAPSGYGNLEPSHQQQHQQQHGAAPGGYGNLEPSHSGQWPSASKTSVNSDGVSIPKTPPPDREPSSVSIEVFAHGDLTPSRWPENNTGRRLSSATTFTQMLKRADLPDVAKGEAFVPDQQFTVPRSPPKPTGRRLA
ncbi:hypothetical protein N0V88_004740 [Collariella sp. IMI 366227]|nr:hypothetical protein N0V88_004740 [Collariella sp. IMI 366227]